MRNTCCKLRDRCARTAAHSRTRSSIWTRNAVPGSHPRARRPLARVFDRSGLSEETRTATATCAVWGPGCGFWNPSRGRNSSPERYDERLNTDRCVLSIWTALVLARQCARHPTPRHSTLDTRHSTFRTEQLIRKTVTVGPCRCPVRRACQVYHITFIHLSTVKPRTPLSRPRSPGKVCAQHRNAGAVTRRTRRGLANGESIILPAARAPGRGDVARWDVSMATS